jgi:hypothetical protein
LSYTPKYGWDGKHLSRASYGREGQNASTPRYFRAFSSQVKSLGGSENATKQKLRAVPVNEREPDQL